MKICPRCGERYSYIDRKKVRDQVYLYAVHYYKVGGKRKVRKCYLGPESEYIYVSRLHEFPLRGPLDRERILKYLRSLVALLVLRKDKFDEKTKREIKEELIRAIESLEG